MVLDRCLSPSLGLSIRVRLEEARGEVGCGRSDSEEEEELLDIEGERDERGGLSRGSGVVIETGLGCGAVAVGDDAALCIWDMRGPRWLFSSLVPAYLFFQLWSTNVLELPNAALAAPAQTKTSALT